jgi:hypothetical protein
MTLFSWLLAVNNHLGIGFWTKRLTPYFTAFVTLYAAYAIPRLVTQAIPIRALRFPAMLLVTLSLITATWVHNHKRYRTYETSSQHVRLYPDELAAIYWLRDHAPQGSAVYTIEPNSGYAWIPAITNLRWVQEHDLHWKELTNPHIFIFASERKSENPPVIENNANIVCQNERVVITHHTPPSYDTN